MEQKKLTFKVHREGKALATPRWRECEVENVTCPLCGNVMMAAFTPKKGLYAYCPRCAKYFIGE